MEPLWAKLISLIVLATFTIVSGLLPLKISGRPKTDDRGHRLLNVLLAFSGGVLLATCFLHLIPEVRRDFEATLTSIYGPYLTALMPWGELTVCVGFLIIYGVEEVIEYMVCRSCERRHHHHGQRPEQPDPDCLAPVHSVHGSHRTSHDVRDCVEKLPRSTSVTDDDVDDQCRQSLDESTPLVRRDSDCKKSVTLANGPMHLGVPSPSATASVRGSVTGLLLICALSFHSVFEGMAIGLQSTAADVWNALLGIALHKFVLAFCVGVELATLRTPPLVFFVYVATFALMSPVGVAIGTAVTETGAGTSDATSGPAVVALQGLASGTLLYVTFFEILAKTKGTELASLMNFAALVVGFAVIAGLHALG